MTRHCFVALVLVGSGVLLTSSAATASIQQCEDRHVLCLGRCADMSGGAGDWAGRQNLCLPACDRRLQRCLVRNAFTRR